MLRNGVPNYAAMGECLLETNFFFKKYLYYTKYQVSKEIELKYQMFLK